MCEYDFIWKHVQWSYIEISQLNEEMVTWRKITRWCGVLIPKLFILFFYIGYLKTLLLCSFTFNNVSP